jgi:tRNA threonylcarbamoyladenosine biosynthesis protein TsaB
MKLLAFETATEACSVALWIDGEMRERFEVAPRRHAELALPWAEQLLAEAGIAKSQLDTIAVGRGPGAFTGVRLAIALAQGIALALDRPVVPVSTLAALAMRAFASTPAQREGEASTPSPSRTEGGEEARRVGWGRGALGSPVLAAIDARMGELYSAAFRIEDSVPIAISEERVSSPGAVELPDDDVRWLGVGTGFAAAAGALRRHLDKRLLAVDASALPHAADVATLAAAAYARGEALPPERLEPAYLRDHVALTLAEQQARRDAR